MVQCKACDVSLGDSMEVQLCQGCVGKQLCCRVCGTEFGYREILNKLPVVQCPTCEGRAIEVLE